jgi:hypothetical protein
MSLLSYTLVPHADIIFFKIVSDVLLPLPGMPLNSIIMKSQLDTVYLVAEQPPEAAAAPLASRSINWGTVVLSETRDRRRSWGGGLKQTAPRPLNHLFLDDRNVTV